MKNHYEYISKLQLSRPDKSINAAICFCSFYYNFPRSELSALLNSQEKQFYNALTFEKRIKSYLMGRYAAKRAIGMLVNEENFENISIRKGVFSQPVVRCKNANMQVSISHCDDSAIAIAFPEEHPMGIDMERTSKALETIEDQMTESEKEIIKKMPYDDAACITALWTMKESIAKTLHTGLMTPLNIYEIAKAAYINHSIISYYANFAQYKSISFPLGPYMCSITLPKNTELYLDFVTLNSFANTKPIKSMS